MAIMILTRTQLLLACIALALTAIPARAAAADLNIQPLSITLSKQSSSGALTLENTGSNDVRLQITGYAWNESGADDLQLIATDDLIIFPTLLTIKPGEQRSIRIGSTVSPNTVEQSYRVKIIELTPDTPGTDMMIQLHAQITLPVFLPPAAPIAKNAPPMEIGGVVARSNTIAANVTNHGNTHHLVRSVHFVAHDAAGAAIFDGSTHGWYILSGITRTYSVPLPAQTCANVKSVSVDLESNDAPVLIHTVLPAHLDCAA
jgi:fimbrial chaperone protein